METLLNISDLTLHFGPPETTEAVVRAVGFSLKAGEKLALVGESGSGKSVTALSILRLLEQDQAHYPQGRIEFLDEELLQKSEAQMRRLRGRDIAMIFQEPMTALNPVYSIGEQLIEPLMLHEGLDRRTARERMVAMLERVGIQEAAKRMDAYPHMLSGGQRQRVMIAMALACKPKLLIADEPTTALDVTVQKQILELLDDLQREFNMAVLLISHDLNMVHHFADRVVVMEKGRVVEQGTVEQVFSRAEHPYTQKLLASDPGRLVAAADMQNLAGREPLLRTDGLNCHFPIKAGIFRHTVGVIKAVDEVELDLRPGETLGIVGESGSGKTTLGMSLLRLQKSHGIIQFKGERIDTLGERQMRPLRKDIQVVFQDPYSSLSPRMTVEQIISEGLRLHFPERSHEENFERMVAVLDEVGLEEGMLYRYPHEFSGGQRQRIAIARAVILEPKLILLDEPTSALDISVQKQVLEVLRRLQEHYGLSYLFISHDLKVIRAITHRVMVMQQGQVVESGETEALLNNPQHEYTRQLLEASLFRDPAPES